MPYIVKEALESVLCPWGPSTYCSFRVLNPQATFSKVSKANDSGWGMGVSNIAVWGFPGPCSNRESCKGDGFGLYQLYKGCQEQTEVREQGSKVCHTSLGSGALS